MQRCARSVLSALLALGLGLHGALAFETSAQSAVVLDVGTGQTLLEKNADLQLPPASMSKLMTLYMTFEALEDGRLTLDQVLPVSQHAASYGGSSMFLTPQDRVTVEDLVRGVVVLSGNDSSAVLAEAISPDGTERGFAQMMTERGQQIGLTKSSFTNSNGWPDPGHRMSMHDLAVLSKLLITDFPQYYPYFAETEFAFDGRVPSNRFNRNPLLKMNIGADGLKTGHTQEAGYGLAGSAVQGERRIVFVLTGLDSERARADESERLVNWAFRQFAEKNFAKSGVVLTRADVWMGAAESVGLTVAEDVNLLVPVLNQNDVTAAISYTGPIEAPIAAGDQVATLSVSIPGFEDSEIPLVATETVARGGFVVRVRTAATALFRKLAGQAAAYF